MSTPAPSVVVVLRELCWSTAESCAGRPLAPPVCAAAKDPKIGALVAAIGVLDGHGSAADESDLARMVPDPDARAEVLDVAAQVMEHRQFKAVRDALWRTLTFITSVEEVVTLDAWGGVTLQEAVVATPTMEGVVSAFPD